MGIIDKIEVVFNTPDGDHGTAIYKGREMVFLCPEKTKSVFLESVITDAENADIPAEWFATEAEKPIDSEELAAIQRRCMENKRRLIKFLDKFEIEQLKEELFLD